jgi:uncharacterized small protein (TIGR04563 family)
MGDHRRQGRPRKSDADRSSDRRKITIYLPTEILLEIRVQADRLDRTVSWLLQRGWKLSKKLIQASPAPPADEK